MSRRTDAAWWYWLATVVFLAISLYGRDTAIYLAIALCLVQIVHFAWHQGSFAAFPVQVRLAYLGLLGAGLWEPLRVVHWIQLIGTSAVVLVDYCFLARVLSLLPWNRVQPFSLSLVKRAIFSRPARGSILHTEPCTLGVPQRMCSLRSATADNSQLTAATLNHQETRS